MKRLLALALSLALLAGCGTRPSAAPAAGSGEPARSSAQSQAEPDPAPEPEPVPEPEQEPVVSHLMVAGDLLIHKTLNFDSYLSDSRSYDFTHIMEGAAPQLALADFALANLETTLAGGPEYSGYPRFNSPDELARDAKASGFDLLSTSNNHTLDKGVDGIFRTLDALDEIGMAHVGTYRTQEEWDENHGVYVADVGGISVAFLAYTYGLNGLRLPSDKMYAVNLFNLDYYTSLTNPDYEQLESDMAYARTLDTDLIAVIMHWGIEYRTAQNAYQEKMAQFLVGQGADLVLGGHPHVLEPYETVTALDPEGRERQGFVVYSLGNFISHQCSEDSRRDLGMRTTVVLDLELTRDAQGNTTLTDVRYTPYYMLQQPRRPVGQRFHLLNIHQSIADYEAGIEGIDKRTYNRLKEALTLCHDILGEEGDKPSM